MESRANQSRDFDVIVVGAGHAGIEAALAGARLGARVGLVTLNNDRIGYMSCNPAIGGVAKGQLVKEIDALGGEMGRNTDRSGIQFKRLNSSKGPAVRSSRAQCDKYLYAANMKQVVETTPGITVLQREVVKILLDQGHVCGVETNWGEAIHCGAVVLTTGTFLGGLMHTGFQSTQGGRAGDQASLGLTAWLQAQGFRLQRLKTGTPARLERRTIDFSSLEEQWGDQPPSPFSFWRQGELFPVLPQVCCWITYTNVDTHDIIAGAFDQSPMFTGIIKGSGPRYCPSIEDKVKRFADKERHQVFLEPEGLQTQEIYANGLSTSLPLDIQKKFLRTIKGLEKVEISRPGYAVEYDCVDPTQLKRTLELKDLPGLFCGGQINGTSGYEEAAAQGLVAGIHAALAALDRRDEELVLSRDEAYIGVMIDDLTLKGADEPYRMFTSRAENRLYLREDNADQRLAPRAMKLGLLTSQQIDIYEKKMESLQAQRQRLESTFWNPTEETNVKLDILGTSRVKDRVSIHQLLRRPEVSTHDLERVGYSFEGVAADLQEQLEIEVKYEGYIRREQELMDTYRRNDELLIPLSLNFSDIKGLSTEVRERLTRLRPETLGQALRIQGMTPAAGAALFIYLKAGQMMGRGSTKYAGESHGQ